MIHAKNVMCVLFQDFITAMSKAMAKVSASSTTWKRKGAPQNDVEE